MGFFSSLFGGGGSSSSTTSNTKVNVDTTTIIKTDKLAEAMQNQVNAAANGNEIANAQTKVAIAEANAKLKQNALFFNQAEMGLKKWAFLGVVSYGGYRIYKKGRLF